MKLIISKEPKYTNCYKLSVTSWENDGDCYNTVTKYITKDFEQTVKALKEYQDNKEDIEDFVAEARNTLSVLWDKLDSCEITQEEYNNHPSTQVEYIQDAFVGYSYESDYPRILESFEVSYFDDKGVEHEVTIEF